MKTDFYIPIFLYILGLANSQPPNSLIELTSFINTIKQTNSSQLLTLYQEAKLFSSELDNFELNKISLSDQCVTDVKNLFNGLRSKQEWAFKSRYFIF